MLRISVGCVMNDAREVNYFGVWGGFEWWKCLGFFFKR